MMNNRSNERWPNAAVEELEELHDRYKHLWELLAEYSQEAQKIRTKYGITRRTRPTRATERRTNT